MQDIERQHYSKIEICQEWQKVLDIFKEHYDSESILKSWFINCRFSISKDNTAIINTSTRSIKDHIEKYKKHILETIWQRVNPDISHVEILLGYKKMIKTIEKQHTAEIIQLPLWAEPARGTPNGVLRGALFSAIHPKNRIATLRREIITDEKNLKILFTGWQLDQSDRDVWELALHMARQQPLGYSVYFTAYGFLKALGRATGKSQHEWLKDAFARLVGCGVEITHNCYTYAGSLLEFERDELTQRYKLSINPKIANLYTAGWTQTDYEERTRIGNKKFLALWLHGYIASHAQLYPTKVETFYRLSGSTNSDMRGFKRYLNNALQHLKEINLIKDFYFEGNLVHIEKYPSNSQNRYLSKRK